MDKIYVVVGTCGQYSDRQEWCARAFAEKAEADAFCLWLAGEWRARAEPRPGEELWDARDRAREEMRALDEGVSLYGYDEPSWCVAVVPWGAP
jgi:hypothetical protein